MRRQGLQGRMPKGRRGLTRQDRTAVKFPNLLHRDFTAPAPNRLWCGDIVRREALFDRVEVRDHRFSVVAAAD